MKNSSVAYDLRPPFPHFRRKEVFEVFHVSPEGYTPISAKLHGFLNPAHKPNIGHLSDITQKLESDIFQAQKNDLKEILPSIGRCA